jgi:hypothetical protein
MRSVVEAKGAGLWAVAGFSVRRRIPAAGKPGGVAAFNSALRCSGDKSRIWRR